MVDGELLLRIPHALGAAEAQRRIAGGVEAARAQYGQLLQAAETTWKANQMSFRLSVLAQTVQGTLLVEDDYVELRAQLPLVVRLLMKRFMPALETTGRKLLR